MNLTLLYTVFSKGAAIAHSVQRRATDWPAAVGVRDSISLLHNVRIGPEADPVSHPIGTRVSFPGSKANGACS
jgi:hypothetical protein